MNSMPVIRARAFPTLLLPVPMNPVRMMFLIQNSFR
jgi:hypothetical protein